MDNIRIEITGEFQKENGDCFTQEEKEKLLDELILFAEKKKMIFIGILT